MQVWENDDSALNEVNEVALKELTQVPVKSRKAGGEGIVHTRTHVKFGSDGESSDEEYEDAALGGTDVMDVDGDLQGAGKAFDNQLDDMSYLKSRASEWKESSDEEEDEEDEDGGSGGDDAQQDILTTDKKQRTEKKAEKKGEALSRSSQEGGPAADKINFDDLSDVSGGEADEDVDVDDTADAAMVEDERRGMARWGREDDNEEEGDYEEGRLVVKNLPYGTNEEELTAFFKRCVC